MDPNIYPRALGSDCVFRRGEQIIVHTNVEMPDWLVRKYRRPAIIFEGRTYFIARKDIASDRKIRYSLEPWTDRFNDLPGKTINYNENYVRMRDEGLKKLKKVEAQRYFLLPLKPLIGFLDSGSKLKIENKFGISARSATFYSLWLEFFCFLAHGILFWVYSLANIYSFARSGSFVDVFNGYYLMLMTTVLLFDMVMRYSSVLREDSRPYGFYEWVFGRNR